METVTNKKSKLLLAGSVVGFALWSALAVLIAKLTDGSVLACMLALGIGIFVSENDKTALPILLMFLIFALVSVAATVLHFAGWQKKAHPIITFTAGIVYVLSVTGIPSAVLCFIGARPLVFLNGKKTILFVAGCIGAITVLFWLLLCTPLSGSVDGKAVFTVMVLAATVLNFAGWRKNNAKMTLAAAILYIVSLAIPQAVLCFIGRGKLKKEAQAK